MNHAPTTLLELLELRARTGPDVRYRFLHGAPHARDQLGHAELLHLSRALGSKLCTSTQPGDRILLMYPPGLDFVIGFFACHFAGLIPVPAFPPHPAWPERSLPRLRSISLDSTPRLILSCSRGAEQIENSLGDDDPLRRLPLWATDHESAEGSSTLARPRPTADTIALLQYTSGSTASPRGVMVSHGNLMHNLAFIRHHQANDAHSRSVSWLPVHHDMGLVEGVLQPLYSGYPAFLMAPATFLQRPLRWLEAISTHRATNSGGPDFAYRSCIERITPEQRKQLDLSSWRAAYNGAEPVRAETLRAFHRAFAPSGFRWRSFFPVYGLAEGTLAVTSGKMGDEPVVRPRRDSAFELVGCGQPRLGIELCIVDPLTKAAKDPGETGEIWVAGPSVARGYWNRPKDSEITFGAIRSDQRGVWLRTGDLGHLEDGELFVTGRLKDLLILRGVKHHPEDLERAVDAGHLALQPGAIAAVSLPTEAGEALAVLAEVKPRFVRGDRENTRVAWQEAMQFIREEISAVHGVQTQRILLVEPGSLPRASSGKLQRYRCRALDALRILAQWSLPPVREERSKTVAATS